VAVTASVVEVDPVAWAAGLDELFTLVVGPAFFRREPRLRARAYLLGLLSGLERKNGWSLAEFAGDSVPDGMQRLLNAAVWDANQVRDALRRHVARQIGSADGVLAVDDTGFLKAGRRSAGVQRQYTGTAGKITNCQIGVFLSYVDPGRRRVLVDRELYLPKSWFAAPDRLIDAGVPDEVVFRTKPEQAWAMIERAADDPEFIFGWVTGDEAYGDNGPLRAKLEGRALNYVMAVSCDHQVTLAGRKRRADQVAAELDDQAWQRYSCGPGSKGERYYDWAWIGLDADSDSDDRQTSLLIRRSVSDPTELAFYRCHATGPAAVTLGELVRVAGSRWSIETCFQATKNEVGLDHYQVRKHSAWYRHITLAMVAHAHLAFTAAAQPPDPPPATSEPDRQPRTDQGEYELATQGASSLWTTERHPAPA
jgi:SRSO17 transposase